MSRASSHIRFENVAELLERLGHIDPARIRLQPPPGHATERDLLRLHQKTDRLYELVDGVLVEKVMGFQESTLAAWIIGFLHNFVVEQDLGILAGADATMRLMPRLVRIPDVSFTVWDKFPVRGEVPDTPIPDLVPDLAVEVLSKKNTRQEMVRKRRDYFFAGVRLVWQVDPRRRTVEVFTNPDTSTVYGEGQSVDGGDVLPGLQLPVTKIFARVPRRSTPPKGPGKGGGKKK